MNRTLAAIIVLAGAGFAGAAIFANQIGIDHNTDWGTGRILLFCTGLLLVLLAAFIRYRERLTGAVSPHVAAILPGWREKRIFSLAWDHRLGILATLCVLVALAIYVFFVSGGTWTNWPETTRYYDDLGVAFRAGRLDLAIQPSPGLMALPDPYEPSARNGVPAVKSFVDSVWDLTFYDGKFYLYWGPAPGLLLAFVKLFYTGAIPDQYLTFAFLGGLLVFSTLLLLRLRRAFDEEVPVALVIIGMLTGALVCPIPWMLNRAAIYEATIAGGQFFLIGGLYFAYTALERRPSSKARLSLATVLWAFSAASRTLMLIPAAFLTFMTILWLVTDAGRGWPNLRRALRSLGYAIPLVLGTLAVGWYNWARFGSALETGLRYTLTFHNLDKFYGESFSAYYALPSLWMFLFNLAQVQRQFPFLIATFGKSPAWLYLNEPRIYHAEEITGLVFSAPFVLFAIASIGNAAQQLWGKYVTHSRGTEDERGQLLLWLTLCLAGSGLLTFAAIVLYFNLTMRFFAEFLPSLMPLAVLGVWQGYRLVSRNAGKRRQYELFVIALGLISIGVSVLLAFSEQHGTVQHYNPHLVRQLIHFFGP